MNGTRRRPCGRPTPNGHPIDLPRCMSNLNMTALNRDLRTDSAAGDELDDIIYPSAIPFVLVHLACIAAIWTGITWQSVALCAALYWLRIFFIGAGYHRYFSHRAFATSRVFQLIL